MRRRATLSPRQYQILQLAADGYSNEEIAAETKCSLGTVRTHFDGIYRRLGVHSKAEAFAIALRNGLVV